jgi:hypothetical protein
VNPRVAFFGIAPGRARDVMQALCIVSEELGRSSFKITNSQLADISSAAAKNIYRQLQELAGAGYLTFSTEVGYRTTFAISLIEQQVRESSRLTMSRVRAALNDLKMAHHEPSCNAPPGQNMAHYEPSPSANTPHHESSFPITANTPHHEPSSPNSPHHEPSLLAGKREGGRGVAKGELLSISKQKSTAFTEINNRQIKSSSSGFNAVIATNAGAGNDDAGRLENPNSSSPLTGGNMAHYEASSNEANMGHLVSSSEEANTTHHESSSIAEDYPMLEALGKQFIRLYPRKSAGTVASLFAFRDAAIAVHEKHVAEGDRQFNPIDAGMYIMAKGRAYERIHEELTEEAKGFTPTAANWLSQGRYDWPEWQHKAQGGAARGNNGRNTTPEAFDLQAALRESIATLTGGREDQGDHGRLHQTAEALREDSRANAHDDVAGVAHGSHAAGALQSVRGGTARGVLPNRGRAVEERAAR